MHQVARCLARAHAGDTVLGAVKYNSQLILIFHLHPAAIVSGSKVITLSRGLLPSGYNLIPTLTFTYLDLSVRLQDAVQWSGLLRFIESAQKSHMICAK